jgi:membrane protease YdiL (CAAX protease family)
MMLEQGIPFGSLLIFFLLFLAVVRNPKVPYFLRFNTLQALLVDIVVVLLGYAFQILLQPLSGAFMLRTLTSTVLVAMLAIVIFALIECLRGREPDLPGISQAVRMQLS